MREEIIDLEKRLAKEGVWKDQQKAQEMSGRLALLREDVSRWEALEKDYFSLKSDFEALETLEKEQGKIEDALREEITRKFNIIKEQFRKEEISLFFSGKYDKGNAILSISAGAGGRDAQDWAAMLLRMYQRYAEKKGYHAVLLDESYGEEGGIKSALIEIRGRYAYGYLRDESGVHRLVRISPFSSQHLRHTSFASVEVIPDISGEDAEAELRD